MPLLPGALELTAAGYVSGGTRNNMAYLEPWVSIAPEVPEDVAVLLQDAQTSGGLLLATVRRRMRCGASWRGAACSRRSSARSTTAPPGTSRSAAYAAPRPGLSGVARR